MINVVFFGTPDFSKKFLEALYADEDIFVSAVVAQPDMPVGRKKVLTSPPTKLLALEHQTPVFQPTKLRDPEFKKKLADLKPDLFVIVAYGRIIPIDVLEIPLQGAINVHPSLLPNYRGPSPIQAAIANQETETGVTIMLIDEQMDHGALLMQQKMKIDASDDAVTMLDKAAKIGAPMLIDSIKKYHAGKLEPIEQNHDKATYCRLINKEDGRVDWNQSAESIEAKSRAYRPWPGIFTNWNGKILKLTRVTISPQSAISPGLVKIDGDRLFIGTGSSPIEVLELQPEGKQPMITKAFLNGNKDIDGAQLSV